VKNLYFTITSTEENPGAYTLVLDFSSLSNMTETKWNKFKILKRPDSNSKWQDVSKAPISATISNRQTDGVWGKFTITGLSSFSEFGGGEGADTLIVSSEAETGENTLKNQIAAATAGDYILFNIAGGNTITLSSPVVINKDLTIIGSDGGIILDGNDATRVMTINDAVSVRLENLTLKNGFGDVAYGGGIWNNGDLTMINCVVADNEESGSMGCGGILQFSGTGDDAADVLNLVNCTITNNNGSSGFEDGIGGLSSTGGTVNIYNTIIYGNTGTSVDDVDESMTIAKAYNSCLENLGNLTITADSSNISDNPQFVGTDNNVTHPYSIGGISPCADTGNDLYCFADYDLRGSGFARKLDKTSGDAGTIDMGAYEYKDGADASLPVTLSSFTGKATKTGVLLQWETSAEIENAGFVIRRQEAGSRNQENGEGNYELPITNDDEDPNSAADHSTNSPSLEGAGGVLLASYLTTNALVGQGSVTKSTKYTFTDSKVEPGKSYTYILSDVDFSGKETKLKEIQIKTEAASAIIAEEYTLRPIYPNPFNATFTVSFTLNEPLAVTIILYNISGQQVMTILNNELSAGNYQTQVNADRLSSGVYFMKTNFSGTSPISSGLSDWKSHTQKIVLMK
jgi:hypothetical protein